MSGTPLPPEGISLRAARPEDRGEIMMLYRRENRRPPDADRMRRRLRAMPGVVAHEGSELVGFISARCMAPDVAELSQMVVATRVRRKGIGSAMVVAMEEALRDGGFRAAVFANSRLHPGNTRGTSVQARRFWLRRGYWEILETEDGATALFAKNLLA
jgi:GNAT superfamily N-acetyltransferase